MKRKRYTDEQIIGMLKEHEAGVTIEDLARRHGLDKSSLHRWKSKYGGMEVSEAIRQNTCQQKRRQLRESPFSQFIIFKASMHLLETRPSTSAQD